MMKLLKNGAVGTLMELSAAAVLLVSLPVPAASSRWPQFRGPSGMGIAQGDKTPIHFGMESNVLWRVELASGVSSPCVWDEHVFLTTFSEGKLATVCLDRKTGRVARNELKERIAATPAVADDTLYVRTDKHLYAFKARP